MIESRYWREDLLNHAKRLKPVKKPPRWSERAVVNFEKELVISFLIIRKLFENHKVSSISRKYRAKVYSCPTTGKKITNRNYMDIYEIYDLDSEHAIQKGITFLANQFIHSGAIFAYREADRNWGGVYLCSDFERKKAIYRVPVEVIREIFELVGNDYPSQLRYTFDENRDDYVLETD